EAAHQNGPAAAWPVLPHDVVPSHVFQRAVCGLALRLAAYLPESVAVGAPDPRAHLVGGASRRGLQGRFLAVQTVVVRSSLRIEPAQEKHMATAHVVRCHAKRSTSCATAA